MRGFVLILSNIFLYLSDLQNVSEYHAAIDGASLKLAEKSERLSLADRELVQRADDHAENLDRQANELEEWDNVLLKYLIRKQNPHHSVNVVIS